ncbi:hypothetical protein C8F04DRAFT_237029 [Mycena alexandri]|uniref:MYND-type domain-containing protein n=1 Tax=Mycena alexandri TaxID=1745969 RepID=A0AAD6WRP4_9AGAR|nr:hypothetical protein C8F04DRAFT_237029 [Mycena alexandri]
MHLSDHQFSNLYSHLWLRLWPWMQFIDTYPYCFPNGPGEAKNCVRFVCQLGRLQSDAKTAALIDSTPGVRILVARAWGFLVGARPLMEEEDEVLITVVNFITRRGFRTRFDPLPGPHIEEFMEGAGGGPADLALLVTKLVDLTSSGPSTSMKRQILEGAVMFLANPEYMKYLPVPTFRSCGVISAMIKAICAFNAGPLHQMIILDGCFEVIHWLIRTSVQEWLTEAVNAGLLRAIISCGTGTASQTHITTLHQTTLPMLAGGSFYYHTLTAIKNALPAVQDLVQSRRFLESATHDGYSYLMQLIAPRLQLLEFYDSDQFYSVRACDNLACGEITKWPDFKRCGACRQRYYCSETCQRADWRSDHHLGCRALRDASLPSTDTLTVRETNFLRAILHQDYLRLKIEILFQQIQFMLAHPQVEFYTDFDYSSLGITPAVKIYACAAAKDDSVPTRQLMSRAQRSKGGMELHRMHLRILGGFQSRWFPMRTDNPILYDAVRRLAMSLRGVDVTARREDIMERLRQLDLEVDDELLAIH